MLDPHSLATDAAAPQTRLMRAATGFSLAVSIFLIALKAAAWFYTDSLSLFSSLVDSTLDMLSSLLNFLAVRYALQPADHEHRFGHGKAEDIAALAQGVFIGASGIFICFSAIERLITPQPVNQEIAGMAVMAVSILATGALVAFQRHVVRKTGSAVVTADSLHYFTDLLTNGAVIVALGLSHFLGWSAADPLFALFIAAYIFYGAWEVGYRAFHNLMDHEFNDEERKRVEDLIRSHPQVLGAHDLKTRRSGIYCFIQCHIEMDENLSLKEAHAVSEAVEQSLKRAYPNAEIIIHEDAVTKR